MTNLLFKELKTSIEVLELSSISEERRVILQPLIVYLKQRINTNTPIRLNFICTHNSRRSHLSQIWAQTMAAYFNVHYVNCYSGGTEATAMFPKVAEILMSQGFKIQALSDSKNPVYSIKYSDNESAIIGFSKIYDDDFNPKSDFAAIMTCSSADAGCPFVTGSDMRITITYQDPKMYDGTPQQTATYLERSIQIATEMKYVFGSLL